MIEIAGKIPLLQLCYSASACTSYKFFTIMPTFSCCQRRLAIRRVISVRSYVNTDQRHLLITYFKSHEK